VAHRIGGRKLSRKTGPRMALYKNLTVSVLRYERVQTTEAKAKEIRGRVERMITLAKQNDLAARRAIVAAFPNEPLVVNKLFDEIAPKYTDRTSGYTRIVKIGARRGDAAPIVQIDFGLGPSMAPRGPPLRRAYRARVEYDGTDFAGFQVQPGARTVQGELEAALARLTGGERQPVDGAGRTDAGVHAAGQVIAFSYAGRLSATELGRALDALLPADVAIRDVRRAPARFHPRYAARYREYRYTVWNGPRSPLRERTALGVRGPARHRRDGAGRVGPRGPARLLGLRGGGPEPGPDRALGSGSGGADRS
jgi:ribosomal protein L17